MNDPILNCLVVGDSWSSAICAGIGAGWPELLGIPQNMRQAVAGSTASQWAGDFDHRLTRAANTPADVVILSLLGNDAFSALADGTIQPEEMASGLFALRRVIDTVRKPRTIVLLYTDPFSGRDRRSAVICARINAAICCTMPDGIEIFDTRTVLLPDHFNVPDIHPNASGHAAIAAGLRRLLSPSVPERSEEGGPA